MPPVLDPSKSKVDGLAFLGLSLARKSDQGHPDSETHQTAYDLNEVLDRDYEFIFSTNDDGWLVGGGEPGPPVTYKLAAKDSAHVEIMRIGTYRKEWGGVPQEEIIDAMKSGEILIPQIEVVPTAVVANPDEPPELEIRFDMEPQIPDFDDPDAPLPINWQLRFLHNQLFKRFVFPSRFCPGAFHSTILRKAEFRSEEHRNKYFANCDAAVSAWRKLGPQPLNTVKRDIHGTPLPVRDEKSWPKPEPPKQETTEREAQDASHDDAKSVKTEKSASVKASESAENEKDETELTITKETQDSTHDDTQSAKTAKSTKSFWSKKSVKSTKSVNPAFDGLLDGEKQETEVAETKEPQDDTHDDTQSSKTEKSTKSFWSKKSVKSTKSVNQACDGLLECEKQATEVAEKEELQDDTHDDILSAETAKSIQSLKPAFHGPVEEKKEEPEDSGSPLVATEAECAEDETETRGSGDYNSGIWLFTDRENVTHFFQPNFLPPYNTPEKRKIILDVLREEWDERTLSWKPCGLGTMTKSGPETPDAFPHNPVVETFDDLVGAMLSHVRTCCAPSPKEVAKMM